MGLSLSRQRLCSLAFTITLRYASPLSEKAAQESELIFWDVGQGDFITVVGAEECWIFDVGGSINVPARALGSLREGCLRKPARMFISHFDKDHIRNYQRVIGFLNLSDAYFSHLDPATLFGKKLLENLKRVGIAVHKIGAGFHLSRKHMDIRCLWPRDFAKLRSENDHSLVFYFRSENVSVLFTGDLPTKMESKFSPPPVDILKVGHHGSKHSSGNKFLKRLHPKICIVSVGRKNNYGHPNPEAMERMRSAHCTILRTDRLGSIHVEI